MAQFNESIPYMYMVYIYIYIYMSQSHENRPMGTFQFELLRHQMAHPAGPVLALEPMGVTVSMCWKT